MKLVTMYSVTVGDFHCRQEFSLSESYSPYEKNKTNGHLDISGAQEGHFLCHSRCQSAAVRLTGKFKMGAQLTKGQRGQQITGST